MTTTQLEHGKALAEAVMPELTACLGNHGAARMYFDPAAGTHGIAVTLHGVDLRYELLMPAPGAKFALFRNGAWLGGLNTTAEAAPGVVALRTFCRIASDVEEGAR